MNRNYIDVKILFQESMVALSLPVFLLVLFFKQELMVAAFLFYYLYVFMIRAYTKHIPSYLHLLQEKKRNRLFPGDAVTLNIGILNTSRITIPNGTIHLTMDSSIQKENKGESLKLLGNSTTLQFSAPPNKRLQWKIELFPQKRGLYRIENLEILLYDWFSTSRVLIPKIDKLETEFLVYPIIKPIRNIEALQKMVTGSQPTNFSFFQDEASISGIKPYEGEIFRQIHWKASLKTQSIVAKKYDRVTHNGMTICLNLSSKHKNSFHIEMENLISYTAFLCQYAAKQKMPFEVFINLYQEGRPITISMKEGVEHVGTCLTALAQISNAGLLVKETAFYKYIESNKSPSVVSVIVGDTYHSGAIKGNVIFVNESGEISGGNSNAASF
ncbi:DUF58 domain-containing protein [Peribacillus alkalitolerans]|uniref:DUF58 domain-containing protein n=1 Tax=Peribacillus alkalitolerans TaxID=1550385 RepID=UPI0013D3D0B8|nr:DUF58 domain-containing protein [Peribacillus alkalitolerans]